MSKRARDEEHPFAPPLPDAKKPRQGGNIQPGKKVMKKLKREMGPWTGFALARAEDQQTPIPSREGIQVAIYVDKLCARPAPKSWRAFQELYTLPYSETHVKVTFREFSPLYPVCEWTETLPHPIYYLLEKINPLIDFVSPPRASILFNNLVVYTTKQVPLFDQYPLSTWASEPTFHGPILYSIHKMAKNPGLVHACNALLAGWTPDMQWEDAERLMDKVIVEYWKSQETCTTE